MHVFFGMVEDAERRKEGRKEGSVSNPGFASKAPLPPLSQPNRTEPSRYCIRTKFPNALLPARFLYVL